jgi:hypothetical protein
MYGLPDAYGIPVKIYYPKVGVIPYLSPIGLNAGNEGPVGGTI